MNGPDDQAMILGALVGLSASTVTVVGLVVWWFGWRRT